MEKSKQIRRRADGELALPIPIYLDINYKPHRSTTVASSTISQKGVWGCSRSLEVSGLMRYGPMECGVLGPSANWHAISPARALVTRGMSRQFLLCRPHPYLSERGGRPLRCRLKSHRSR